MKMFNTNQNGFKEFVKTIFPRLNRIRVIQLFQLFPKRLGSHVCGVFSYFYQNANEI